MPPDGVTWVLESLDGRPLIEGTFATLKLNGDSYGGVDGCNSFGGRSEDGTPVADADGTFSAPLFSRTLEGCVNPAGILDQADAYTRALMQGERFRVTGDRLEILDGAGETRLVLVKQAALPGRPVDLVGTGWRLLTEGDGDGGVRASTLAFLDDHLAAGETACRGYVAGYGASEGRVGFPSLSMTGPTESCPDELIQIEGRFTTDLSRVNEYSVHEDAGTSRLRIRTSRGRTLTFEPLPPAVDGIFDGGWSLRTFVEPHEYGSGMWFPRTTDVLVGTEVTISFRKTGVSGSAGCNSYEAPLSVEDASITIGALSATEKSCADRTRLMDQERRYLDLLPSMTRFRIYGDRLYIHTDDGMALLLFQAE